METFDDSDALLRLIRPPTSSATQRPSRARSAGSSRRAGRPTATPIPTSARRGPSCCPEGWSSRRARTGPVTCSPTSMSGATAAVYEGTRCATARAASAAMPMRAELSSTTDRPRPARSTSPAPPARRRSRTTKPGRTSFTPLWQGPSDALGPPIVSAGLVWSLATAVPGRQGTTLYGLEPATGTPTYTETLPSAVVDHFASPSAAGGRLFVSSGESVTAYQIAQPATGASPGPVVPIFKMGANTSLVPTLLHTYLRAGRHGRVRVALRCPAAAGTCRGTVTLVAEIATIVRRGGHRVRQVVAIRLARARFGPHKGQFTVVLKLSRSAEARLRRHHDRLTLQVVIASSGGTRRVGAVLTQANR